ncbi:MAG: hypothetical protein U9O98_06785, partial [Asgard group archaeon]|nr:hypothetical protein [Asgard group archaeon]
MPDPRCRNCLKEIAEKTIRLSTDNKKEQKELINFFNNYIDDHFESMHLPDISTDILQLIAKKTETIDPFH